MATVDRLLAHCEQLQATSHVQGHVVVDDAAARAWVLTLEPHEMPVATSNVGTPQAKDTQLAYEIIATNAINFSYFPDEGEPRWYTQHGDCLLVGDKKRMVIDYGPGQGDLKYSTPQAQGVVVFLQVLASEMCWS